MQVFDPMYIYSYPTLRLSLSLSNYTNQTRTWSADDNIVRDRLRRR